MRILVRAPNWIGDQVLAFPFFHYLREAYPDAKIVSVCVDWVRDLQYRDLVDEVVPLARPAGRGLKARFDAVEETARLLRERGPWDLGISLPNSISSAWLLFRASVKRRRGYRVEGRGLFLNEGLPWDASSSRHRGQAYVDLLPDQARPKKEIREFWGVRPESDLEPGTPGELQAFAAERQWPGTDWLEAPVPSGQPYWVLAPGATAESRRWPSSAFIALARTIRTETGWPGVVVGGPKEAPLAVELCEDSSLGLVDFTAEGTVPSLWRVFAGAKFTVCNESGLAHVASLAGSFVQIVCGAADPLRTRPLGPGRVQVAINPIECWPCERNVCLVPPPAQKLGCLMGIRPDTVWEEIKRGLRKP